MFAYSYYHPVSNFIEKIESEIKTLLKVIDNMNMQTIIIYPNSDPGSHKIIKIYKSHIFNKNKFVNFYKNIPENYFVNLMRYTNLIMGNSSMGILESPIFQIPVLNIGKRQRERENAGNIIYVNNSYNEIIKVLYKLKNNKKFIINFKNTKNIFGSGNASRKIANKIANLKISKQNLIKNYKLSI